MTGFLTGTLDTKDMSVGVWIKTNLSKVKFNLFNLNFFGIFTSYNDFRKGRYISHCHPHTRTHIMYTYTHIMCTCVCIYVYLYLHTRTYIKRFMISFKFLLGFVVMKCLHHFTWIQYVKTNKQPNQKKN